MHFRAVLAACLAAALAPAVAVAQAPVGLTLYVQPWDIATDTDTPVLALESPSLISDAVAVADGWAASKAQTIIDIKAQIGAADGIAPGFTMHDINLDIGDPALAFRSILPGGAGPLTVLAESAGMPFRLEASVTVPSDLITRDMDPRCRKARSALD